MTVEFDSEITVPAKGEVADKARFRGLAFIAIAVGAAGFTMFLHQGLTSNFMAEEMGITARQLGFLDGFRECCGFFALIVFVILAGITESTIASLMLVLMAIGFGSLAFVPDYAWLLVTSLVWSMGFHVWLPLPQSMTLALAEPGREGFRLGQMRRAGAAGAVIGILVGLILSKNGIQIRLIYMVAAVGSVLAALVCLGIPRKIKTKCQPVIFRRKYWLFYLLSFLEGGRKQVFIVFAGFLMVRKFGTPLDVMLMLWLAIQVISYLAGPWVGKLIDRFGERRILVFYFSCLMLFFLGYAFSLDKRILFTLYVIDGSFFIFVIALTTFVNRIAPPAEHTATLSMGVAINHIAAVGMPLVGGLLWDIVGYQWVFIFGAIGAGVSALVSLLVPEVAPKNPAVEVS